MIIINITHRLAVSSLVMFMIATIMFTRAASYPHPAVVISPVVDLLGAPFGEIQINNPALKEYHAIPYAPKNGSYACPRLHQLLFNEIVIILHEQGDHLCIDIPNLYFQIDNSDKRYTTYWAQKKHFKPLHELTCHKEHIPTTCKNPGCSSAYTITLRAPYYHSSTKITYSAGTSFVYNRYEHHHYYVYAYNPLTNHFDILKIPASLCINHTPTRNQDAQIHLFLDLLKQWARPPFFIPYVWGGSSFTHRCAMNDFYEQTYSTTSSSYQRPSSNNPKSGFDCSGMISRAAQMSGIPYFFKNSSTIKRNLKEVTKVQDIQEGDILWMPGHVMVISDVPNNMLIEAAGYDKGYGKVHEIALDKTFKNITTFAQLFEAIIKKIPVQRLDCHANVIQKINEIKILQLKSTWLCTPNVTSHAPQCNTLMQQTPTAHDNAPQSRPQYTLCQS